MQYEAWSRSARQLSQQLADGKRLSSVCALCLVKFAYNRALGNGPRLREDCHELLDGCILMLLTPRMPDELARLERRPGHCHRHDVRADLPIPELLMIIWDALDFVVSEALHSGNNAPAARAHKTQKAFANSAGHWPTRLDQLLPFGATPTVSWLLDLAEQRISGAPLGMLGNCVVMARGVVLPVILADNNRTRLVSILCSTLRMANPGASWRRDPVDVAALFIQRLRHGPGCVPRDFERLVAGCEPELYQAACDAILDAPDSIEHLDDLVECCAKLHDMLGARAPRPAPERVQQHLSTAIARRPVQPLYLRLALAHVLISQAAGAPRCAAPDCGLAVLQSGDRAKFQVCARCRVPRYCSRGCQARAWSDAVLPHRAVCPVLSKLSAQEKAHPDKPLEAFACAVAGLSIDETEVFNAWLTACREEFGTAPELVSGPVDVRDPMRFVWKFARYMCYACMGLLFLSACGYPLGPLLMASFCILCFSFAASCSCSSSRF